MERIYETLKHPLSIHQFYVKSIPTVTYVVLQSRDTCIQKRKKIKIVYNRIKLARKLLYQLQRAHSVCASVV